MALHDPPKHIDDENEALAEWHRSDAVSGIQEAVVILRAAINRIPLPGAARDLANGKDHSVAKMKEQALFRLCEAESWAILAINEGNR